MNEHEFWLCRNADGKFDLLRGHPVPADNLGNWTFEEGGEWIDRNLSEITADFIHPNHGLKPGQAQRIRS